MTPQVHVSVGSGSVGVGDPFDYVVEAQGVAPVRVTADTGPFVAVAAPHVARSGGGGGQVVRVTQQLICVDRGCVPGAGPRRVLLPAVHVTSGDGTASARAAVTLVPRVPAKAVAASRAPYRTQVDVPPASSPVPAGLLAALLVVAAVVLAALAVWVAARGRRRQLQPRGRKALGLLDALRLLRESAGRPPVDRRRAADLAGRLAPNAHAEAMRVAWARPDPDAGDVTSLATQIETEAG